MAATQFDYHEGSITEERRHDRCHTHIPARLLLATGELVCANIMNVSKHGFMAECDAEPASGDPIELEVVGYLPFHARVVWCADGRVGCEFTRILSFEHFTCICGHAQPRLENNLFRRI